MRNDNVKSRIISKSDSELSFYEDEKNNTYFTEDNLSRRHEILGTIHALESLRKTVVVFTSILLLFMIIACNQIKNPMETQEAANAPGADVNGEEQPVIDCSEPAYLISASHEIGTIISEDTEITFTFSCAPEQFGLDSGRYFQPKRYNYTTWHFDDVTYGMDWLVSEQNRNIAKIRVIMSQHNLEHYKRVGRPAKIIEWNPYLLWQHGTIPMQYKISFSEIIADPPPPNVDYQDILDNPNEFQGREVTFEAIVLNSEVVGRGRMRLNLETQMVARRFYVNDSKSYLFKKVDDERFKFNNKKFKFSCLIDSISEMPDGLVIIDANLIYTSLGVLVYPPVPVE